MSEILMVSPRGGERQIDGESVDTFRLQEAIDKAEAGNTIRLLPGVYDEPGVFRCKSGTKKSPIILEGDGGVTLDSRRSPFRPPDDHPTFEQPAFLKIKDCKWIVIRDLAIQNAWPTAIYIEHSSHLSIRRVNFHGGTFAICCRGRGTHDVLITRCAWTQDPDIWQDIHWDDIHAFPRPRKELDGDFLRAVDVTGRFEIRRNLISNAFNGVHFFALTEKPEPDCDKDKDDPCVFGELEVDYDPQVNKDIVIANNTFTFIRDNAVESEFQATNWWIYGNRIFNCHKWFALENSQGGYWYIFANTGWFDRKPGPPTDENNGGSVLKTTTKKKWVNEHPIYMFHNSWYLRSSFMKKGLLREFRHFNNAIEFCDPANHPPGVGQFDRRMFGEKFLNKWVESSDSIQFHNDVCNHGDFAELILRDDLQVEGRVGQLSFKAPRDGFFGPDPEKEEDGIKVPDLLTGQGVSYTMELIGENPDWHLPEGLNIGAIRCHNTVIHRDVAYGPEDFRCPENAEPKADIPEESCAKEARKTKGAS